MDNFAAVADAGAAGIIDRERKTSGPGRGRVAGAPENGTHPGDFRWKTYEEIALIMDVSLAAVETLLFRARRNLGKILRPLKNKGACWRKFLTANGLKE